MLHFKDQIPISASAGVVLANLRNATGTNCTLAPKYHDLSFIIFPIPLTDQESGLSVLESGSNVTT